jgi:hypothetical protein
MGGLCAEKRSAFGTKCFGDNVVQRPHHFLTLKRHLTDLGRFVASPGGFRAHNKSAQGGGNAPQAQGELHRENKNPFSRNKKPQVKKSFGQMNEQKLEIP